MKLCFVLGTSGELIKLYPVMLACDQRGLSWKALLTGQSGLNCVKQWEQFALPHDKLSSFLPLEKDLESSREAFRWFQRALRTSSRELSKHLGSNDVILVHGDTLSTLVGAKWAKKMSRPLAHIEAGLRSKSLLRPFPEEINRRWVSKLADFHFAPDSWSKNNLLKARVKGQIIETGGNTMGEALEAMLKLKAPENLPRHEFVLANIHRFENLNSKTDWKLIVETLVRAAVELPVYLVVHPSTGRKIEEDQLKEYLTIRNVHLIARKPFHEFAHWLKGCKYLLTDGGSNQEECFYLGKPCLILRRTTERNEGLGENCVLSRFDAEVIQNFLAQPLAYLRPPQAPGLKPSEIILDSLLRSLS